MSAPLAKTTLQLGADDRLAAVDLYTQTVSLAPTESVSEFSLSDGIKTLTGTPISLADSVEKTDSLKLSEGIASIGGQFNSAFQTLETGLKDFLTGVKGSIGVSMVNGKPKLNFNLKSAVNIAGMKVMLNVMSGTKGLLGKISIAGQKMLLGKMINVSAKMGIGDAFTKIMASVDVKDVRNHVGKIAAGIAGSTGSVSLLASIADAKFGGKIDLKLGPMLNKFSANFKIPLGTKPGNYIQLGASISSSFSKISPSWSVSLSTKGKSLINGSIFLKSSKDFKTVMKASANRDRIVFGAQLTSTNRVSQIPARQKNPNSIEQQRVQANRLYTTRKDPNGRKVEYVPDGDGYLEKIYDPISLSSATSSFDNSGFSDPFTIGHVLSDVDSRISSTSSKSFLQASPQEMMGLDNPGFYLGQTSEQYDI